MIQDFKTKHDRLGYGRVTIKDILSILLGAVVVYIGFDIAGAILWMVSGQVPVTNFYLGAITNLIIK